MSAINIGTRSRSSPYQNRTSFRIVEYDEGRGRKKKIELIPSEWISEDHNKQLTCKWPVETSGLSSLTRIVKYTNTESQDIIWKSYPARLIGADVIVDYEEGLALLDRAEQTSNLELSEPDSPESPSFTVSRKRKATTSPSCASDRRKQTRQENIAHTTSSEEASEAEDAFDPPHHDRHGQELQAQNVLSADELSDLLESQDIQVIGTIPDVDEYIQSHHNLLATPNGTLSCEGAINLSKFYSEFRKYQEVSLSLMKNILNEVRDIRSQQEVTRQPGEYDTAVAPQFRELPLSAETQLDEFESLLESEEKKQELVNYLSSIGGKDVPNLVRRILKRLFSGELETKINFTGRGNKFAFKNLNIYASFIRAVRQNTIGRTSTEREIELAAQNFFRFAKDRHGGRQKRTIIQNASAVQ